MYYDDHNPPHFHAIYAGEEVEIGIEPLTILKGRFPRRALGMVLEWAAMYRQDLLANWDRLHNDTAAERIEPLQ
jgi:hypothetical protein